tara:strand:+ start:245 stop:754 length:510 start_codon:yes stop_codon:yes gene_type:complete
MRRIAITGAYSQGKLGGDGTRKEAKSAGPEPSHQEQLRAVGAALLEQESEHEAWNARAHVLKKIQGYRAQDRKNRPDAPAGDLTVDGVLEALVTSRLRCYYCREPVKLLYSLARDPAQWTLDRIDNSASHTHANTLISCMRCNLGRRTKDSQAYRDVKQMVVVRAGHAD